jgi:hypothetical protein
LGKAEENDIFRDLNLFELINSSTDGISYSKEWFTKHKEGVIRMLPAGMEILGMYTFSIDEEIDAKQIRKWFKKNNDLFLLSHTAESGWARAYFYDENNNLDLSNPVEVKQDKGVADTLREANIVITHEFIYKVPKTTKANALNFKEINSKVLDCLDEIIEQSFYSIESKIVKTTQNISFKSLLEVKYQAKDEIEKLTD